MSSKQLSQDELAERHLPPVESWAKRPNDGRPWSWPPPADALQFYIEPENINPGMAVILDLLLGNINDTYAVFSGHVFHVLAVDWPLALLFEDAALRTSGDGQYRQYRSGHWINLHHYDWRWIAESEVTRLREKAA